VSDLPKTIYSSNYIPVTDRAVDVLAFLLLHVDAIINPDSTQEEIELVSEMLHESKRSALLDWYSRQPQG
jgi:chaperone required for assembly of F1-ATPase